MTRAICSLLFLKERQDQKSEEQKSKEQKSKERKSEEQKCEEQEEQKSKFSTLPYPNKNKAWNPDQNQKSQICDTVCHPSC